MLEQGIDLPLDDYRHTCARAKVTGDGVIDVYPSGLVNEHYLAKLSKLDLEMATAHEMHRAQANPLKRLLSSVQADSQPDLSVLDASAAPSALMSASAGPWYRAGVLAVLQDFVDSVAELTRDSPATDIPP